MSLVNERLQNRRDGTTVRSGESVIRDEHALVRAHRHLTAENLLVVLTAHGHNRDCPAHPADDLDRLFRRIVIKFIDRINQIVTLDVRSRAVELDLVLRRIRHSFRANKNFHVQSPATASVSSGTAVARTICSSTSSVRSIALIVPSKPATLIASSMFDMQDGHAVTMTFAPASAAIRTRFTAMRSSSFGS